MMNRNHFFAIGLVVLMLGIQIRLVESVRLTEKSSRFIAEKFEKNKPPDPNPIASLLAISQGTTPRKTIRPPKWLGWSLISVGAVLILHSLAMKKPQ